MKRFWLVSLSVALVTAAVTQHASAASRGAAHRTASGDGAIYNDAGRGYDGGTFAGGVYRPAGDGGNGAAGYDYYPTRDIVRHSFVPVDSYYGPLCNPRIDRPCQ
jgi:hypothetical protein